MPDTHVAKAPKKLKWMDLWSAECSCGWAIFAPSEKEVAGHMNWHHDHVGAAE